MEVVGHIVKVVRTRLVGEIQLMFKCFSFLHSLPPSLSPSFLPACLPTFLSLSLAFSPSFLRISLPGITVTVEREGGGAGRIGRGEREGGGGGGYHPVF
jgi:hypothetical protein